MNLINECVMGVLEREIKLNLIILIYMIIWIWSKW